MRKIFLYFVLLVMPVSIAFAATGDLVGSVHFDTPCSSGIGVGVAFDGTNLWYSCYTSATDLYKADPITGAVLASYSLNGGLGALAYDAGRNAIWAGWGNGADSGHVYKIQLDGSKNFNSFFDVFTNLDPVVVGLDDGLAFDASDDTLYISDDTSTTIHHLKTDGTHLGDFSWAGSGCYNSGLAIGGDLLYQGSNGCNHVWVVDKVSKAASFDFSTVQGNDLGFRDEDLECDTNTFASSGKHVMWSVEAYDINHGPSFGDRRALAFEIPFGSCGVGGEKAPVCGNGIVEGAEQCDDGNTADGDGCSANCIIEEGNHEVPEFTTIGAGIVIVGAAGYALLRRKKK